MRCRRCLQVIAFALFSLIVAYLLISGIYPAYSQNLRDSWRGFVENPPPIPRIVVVAPSSTFEPGSSPDEISTTMPTAHPTPTSAVPTASRPITSTIFTSTPTSTATLTPTPSATPYPATPSLPPTLSQMQKYMLQLINAERGRPLFLDYNKSAQIYADELAERCSNSHTGLDGSGPVERFKRAARVPRDYSWLSENIFGWTGTNCTMNMSREWTIYEMIDDAHQRLMASPGHRLNIMQASHESVALGFAVRDNRIWVVQVFISPR